MTTINSKMGLKPAGKRAMMKLPTDRELRNRITAAQCPECSRRGAHLSKLKTEVPMLVCGSCAHTWELPA